MWDVLIAFFTVVKVLAIIGLVIFAVLIGLLVAIYLIDEFKLLRVNLIQRAANSRAIKKAKKEMDQESWEKFFFEEAPHSFHNTGEIIRPQPPIAKEDTDDLGVGKEGK